MKLKDLLDYLEKEIEGDEYEERPIEQYSKNARRSGMQSKYDKENM